jgi:hypothetical protein
MISATTRPPCIPGLKASIIAAASRTAFRAKYRRRIRRHLYDATGTRLDDCGRPVGDGYGRHQQVSAFRADQRQKESLDAIIDPMLKTRATTALPRPQDPIRRRPEVQGRFYTRPPILCLGNFGV